MRTLLYLFLMTPALLWADGTMLAKKHHDGIAIQDYFVSEKLDGIRARWTGRTLETKTGHPIHAPAWFTQPFPEITMDGELWIDRGRFQKISTIVLDKVPNHTDWQSVRYMIFDLPEHGGIFAERVAAMRQLTADADIKHLMMIDQFRVESEATLHRRLEKVESQNGEGLMLHHQENRYRDGRSNGLLKLKSFQDAEATVIGYTQGKGKFTGLIGALHVRTSEGIEFKLGSGLSIKDRRHPPPKGSVVTFKYYGLTTAGKPRFASYLRMRDKSLVSDSE